MRRTILAPLQWLVKGLHHICSKNINFPCKFYLHFSFFYSKACLKIMFACVCPTNELVTYRLRTASLLRLLENVTKLRICFFRMHIFYFIYSKMAKTNFVLKHIQHALNFIFLTLQEGEYYFSFRPLSIQLLTSVHSE